MSNPSSALKDCTEWLNDSKITVQANGRFATFLNRERAVIQKIDVDCWLRDISTAKADFVVSKPGVVDVIVELKGKDIDHAVEQISATLARWKSAPPNSNRFGGLIIFTRSPMRSAAHDNIKAKMLKKFGIWLEMDKSGLRDYDFSIFTGARR